MITDFADKSNFLFCYFTGNLPQEEAVHFALSRDGYNFTPLNNNQPVIKQRLGKKSCRDPFIFRDEENVFHIIATDMRCHDGWNSNNSMVMWDSEDLIEWKNERIFDFSRFDNTKSADRVWAPEVIYDKFRDEYMIYWSHHNTNDSLDTVIWFIYTKDFNSFTTEPQLLFAPKSNMAGIDADIIEYNSKYYMFYADEEKSAICYAVADCPSGPYFEPESNIASVADTKVEGNCIYKNPKTNKFIMIMDKFVDGGYFMQEGDSLLSFKKTEEDNFSLNHLHPRHGSMLLITNEEYNRLQKAL